MMDFSDADIKADTEDAEVATVREYLRQICRENLDMKYAIRDLGRAVSELRACLGENNRLAIPESVWGRLDLALVHAMRAAGLKP